MEDRTTREALLAEGAMLFARHGVAGVTARQIHDAIGARNESALHYHFGGRDGLVAEIVIEHLAAIEERRAVLVAAIVAEDRTRDLRSLVHALAAPMAQDLESPIGRAHLRVVAQISPPALAYVRPFQSSDAPSGASVVAWLRPALDGLPARVRTERLAVLRGQLISLFGLRAQLIDDQADADDGSPSHAAANGLFLANLVDMIVAGLATEPSPDAVAAAARRRRP